MLNMKDKMVARHRRHRRVRKTIFGTPQRPRLIVFRSNLHIYAQVIDDTQGLTLANASSVEKACRKDVARGSNKKAAEVVGQLIAKRAIEKGVKAVVFDRGGYLFHGRVKSLADAARRGGLLF